MSNPQQTLRIFSITVAAEGVLTFDLRSPVKADLPPFEPGAHINLHLPDGVVRSYSLLNDARERHRYVVAIKREAAGRGGSAWMHEQARVAADIAVSGPSNSFALAPDAAHSVFFAGGIGITPLWSMAQWLSAVGKPWTLHYRAQSRSSAALLDELTQSRYAENVRLSFSDEPITTRLDIKKVVECAPVGAHFYCCGPAAMIKAFEVACAGVEEGRVHAEHFSALEAPATAGGFKLRLAKSGSVLDVHPGQTILAALTANGLTATSACQQGVCGECEVRVLSGTPDHRDLVLSATERAEGRSMMICCSGSLSPELTIDL